MLDRNGNLTLSGLINNLAADIERHCNNNPRLTPGVAFDDADVSNSAYERMIWIERRILQFMVDNGIAKLPILEPK